MNPYYALALLCLGAQGLLFGLLLPASPIIAVPLIVVNALLVVGYRVFRDLSYGREID
jgi:hypothetical protein